MARKSNLPTPLSFYRDSRDNDNLYLDLDHRDWSRLDAAWLRNPDCSDDLITELQYQMRCSRQDEGHDAYHAYWEIHDALDGRDLSEYPRLATALAWFHADDGLTISKGYCPDGYVDPEDVPNHVCDVGSAVRYLRVIADDFGDTTDIDRVLRSLARCQRALYDGTVTTEQLANTLITVYEILSECWFSNYKFSFEYKTKHSELLIGFIDSVRDGDSVEYYLSNRPANYYLR